MSEYGMIPTILVLICIASILSLIVPHMLHNMNMGNFALYPVC